MTQTSSELKDLDHLTLNETVSESTSNALQQHVIRCSSCGCQIPAESFSHHSTQCTVSFKSHRTSEKLTSLRRSKIRKVRKSGFSENRGINMEECQQRSSFSSDSAEVSPPESSESFSADEYEVKFTSRFKFCDLKIHILTFSTFSIITVPHATRIRWFQKTTGRRFRRVESCLQTT
jgi:hypothetical protein